MNVQRMAAQMTAGQCCVQLAGLPMDKRLHPLLTYSYMSGIISVAHLAASCRRPVITMFADDAIHCCLMQQVL
jgi:hypothetical protein